MKNKLNLRERKSKRTYSIFTAALILIACRGMFCPVLVHAGVPLEQLKKGIGEITDLLDNKEYRKTHTKEQLKQKLIEVAEDNFYWEEIAKRSLGLYWKERSPEEKREFTALLKDLLINTYLDKIIDNYSGESILYDKELIRGNRAFIELRIINKSEKSISLGIRMLKKGERWLIYDLIIEGVSSVKNYRVQFYDIIRQSSYSELLKKLQEKVKALTVDEKKK